MTKISIPDNVLNSVVESEVDDLEQFGVKGMKWGIRRNLNKSKSGVSKSTIASIKKTSEEYDSETAAAVSRAEAHLARSETYKALAENYEAGHGDPPGFKRPKGMTNAQLAKNARTQAKGEEGMAKIELGKAFTNMSKANEEMGKSLTAYADHYEAGHGDPPGFKRPKGMTNAQLAKNARESARKAFKVAEEAREKADQFRREGERILKELEDEGLLKQAQTLNLDDLEQFGIKGMKWGVRKDTSGSSSKGHKPAKTMTDQELRDAVARMNLERSYSKLVSEKQTKSVVERGSSVVGSMVGNAAKNAVQNYMQQAFAAAIKVGVAAAAKKAGVDLPEFLPLPKDN